MRHSPQNPAQVLGEAHIEEAVTFVNHHHFGLPQRVRSLFVVVNKATRCADQEVGAALQYLALLAVIQPTEDYVRPDAGVVAETLGVVRDLHCQLARRCHDQSPRCLRRSFPGDTQKMGKDGQ